MPHITGSGIVNVRMTDTISDKPYVQADFKPSLYAQGNVFLRAAEKNTS